MKSILKNIASVRKRLWLAIAAAFMFLSCDSMLSAQQEFEHSFDAQAVSSVHQDTHVAPADFQPMEIPQAASDDHAGAESFASDIPAVEDFTVSDEIFAELVEAENSDSSFLAGVSGQFADLDLAKMLGSLAIVLGGYFGIVWLLRKINPASSRGLPVEVVEVLGATPFGPKKHLQVIRLGSKLLLLINSTEGSQLIGEVSDPQEVEYLASLCTVKRRKRAVSQPVARPASDPARQPQRSTMTDHQPAPPAADNLRDVLQQLQNVVRSQPNGSVFEA